MDTQNVTASVAQSILRNTNGRFFSVIFKKKDNTTRRMVARLNVKKNLVGGVLPYNPQQYGLLPVFDVEIGQYRMVNLSSLISFRSGGVAYNVESQSGSVDAPPRPLSWWGIFDTAQKLGLAN